MSTTSPGREWMVDLAIAAGIFLSVLALYTQVGNFDFLAYDDDQAVYNNLQVQEGLTPENIRWAFTAVVTDNWMPVTVLSHMAAWSLFDADAGKHHWINVLFHALSAVLLFALLKRSSGARWPSAFVAAIFAMHPLNVGSVAWVAERKGVLSAFFGFLALYAYVRYSERPDTKRYLAVVAPFIAGLMCKVNLATFPFALLLFDFWPLRRTGWRKLVAEKLPLIALSIVSSVAVYFVQRGVGAVNPLPLHERIANTLVSYAIYLGQMIWPEQLSILYPYPRSIAVWKAVGALALIAGISAAVIRARKTRPYLAMGWFWYLGTMFPVSGLVQVGMHAHADRHMYVPMVGLCIMLAWGMADIIARWPVTRPAIAALAGIACVLCAAAAWKELGHWHDTETVLQRAIDVTANNWIAEAHLAYFLMNTPGRESAATAHFEALQQMRPNFAEESTLNAANFIRSGNCEAAMPQLEAALRLKPGLAAANGLLGICKLREGDYQAAASLFEIAIRVKPDYAEMYFALGEALSKIPGRTSDAIAQYEAFLRIQPNDTRAHRSLAMVLAGIGKREEAVKHLESAQRIHPDPEIAREIERLRM